MLSIIVLNHNKSRYSELLLDSLLESSGGPFEFVLVDNGSTDATPETLAFFADRAIRAGHQAQVMTFSENVGAIVGRNEAMKVAAGRYFAFLDNDLVLRDRDWAERLIEVLESDETIGIVSPKLVFPWEPYAIEFAGCDVTPGARVIYRGRGEPNDTPEFNQRRDCPCLISACIVFGRDLYREIGELDEIYSPVQFEDLDFCYRARAAHYRCVFVPEVEMYHWEHTTTAGSSDINFQLVTLRNQRTFKRRWGEQIAAEAEGRDEDAGWRSIERQGIEIGRPPVRR